MFPNDVMHDMFFAETRICVYMNRIHKRRHGTNGSRLAMCRARAQVFYWIRAGLNRINIFIRKVSCVCWRCKNISAQFTFAKLIAIFFILKKWSDDHGHNNRRVMRHFVQLRRIVSNGDIARNDRWIRRITEQHYCSRRILSHATMRGSGMKGCYNHSLF